jgi:hypothetical protein
MKSPLSDRSQHTVRREASAREVAEAALNLLIKQVEQFCPLSDEEKQAGDCFDWVR